MAPEALISQIAALLGAAGRSAVVTEFEALPAGGNNRVYRVRAGGADFTAKHYFHEAGEQRDRLSAEYAFLQHAWRCGIRSVPAPVAMDARAHIALYGFVAGRRVEARDIDARRVRAAAEFFAALNSQVSRASAVSAPEAADACASVSQHVRSIDARIERLSRLPGEDREASAFIAELATFWSEARARILRASPDADRVVAE